MPLVLPGLFISALTLGWYFTGSGMPRAIGWGLYAIYGAAFTVLAVGCHRLVLLGPSPATSVAKVRWGLRETKFLGWAIVLWLTFAVGHILIMLLIANVVTQVLFWGMTMSEGTVPTLDAEWLRWPDYIGRVVSAYVVARLSLVLPATAIDRKVGLRWAWQQSARNGWCLALIVGVFPWALSHGVDLLYRENATLPELAILITLSVLASMLGIIALSLSYQDLESASGAAEGLEHPL